MYCLILIWKYICTSLSRLCAVKHQQLFIYGGADLNIWIGCDLNWCCLYPSVDHGNYREHNVTNVTKKFGISASLWFWYSDHSTQMKDQCWNLEVCSRTGHKGGQLQRSAVLLFDKYCLTLLNSNDSNICQDARKPQNFTPVLKQSPDYWHFTGYCIVYPFASLLCWLILVLICLNVVSNIHGYIVYMWHLM